METLDTVWVCLFLPLTPPGRKVILSAVYFSSFKNLSAFQSGTGTMPWALRDQAQMRKGIRYRKVVANIFHRAIWAILRNAKRIRMKTVRYLWEGMTSHIFHQDTEQLYLWICSSCKLPHRFPQQLTRTTGRTIPGWWAPGLLGSASRSAVFFRAKQAHWALYPLWYTLGSSLLCGAFPGMWQLQCVRMARAQ